MIELSQLNLFVFSGRHPAEAYQEQYQKAFELWKSVWSATFLELDGNGRLFSDDFVRQDAVLGIFYQDQCIALGCLNGVDFRLPTAKLDSYLRSWNQEGLNKLAEDGPLILNASYITVHPNFRGDIGGTSLKYLLTAFSVKYLLSSGYDVMSGTMRNNRGMDKMAYIWGATQLVPNIEFHGVAVDLVGFFRRRILADGRHNSDLTVERIWNSRQYLTPDQEKDTTAYKKGA